MTKQMTIQEIKKDPWAAVYLPLPQSPNARLLAVARRAAGTCKDQAWKIISDHDREDADSVGHAAEMSYAAEEAEARIDEINSFLRPRAVSATGAKRSFEPR